MSESNPLIPLVQEAVFGKQVEEFLSSDIGIYLVKKAEAEASDAIEKLKTCPADDPKAIRTLQNQIFRAESIQQWLGEAIHRGLEAIQNIDERE